MPRKWTVFLPKFGAFLRALRRARRWNSRAQAISMGERRGIAVSYQALRQLEEGITKSPDPKVLKALATLYDVPYEDLVRRCIEEGYGVTLSDVASIPHSPGHVADAARVRELERRAEQYEQTLGELSAVAAKLVQLAARGAEDRAPARRPSARGRRHRTGS
ncbi:MAG TPA: helix-turn-helix domain-containing protein [Methylomirabilota bacterium]|jgi:transcriptional regulator with XRE-family HTH domain|nr:helix-turn-helix domain-containing protein [Methylomirabilota bacterium]